MWFYLNDLEFAVNQLKQYVNDAPLSIESVIPAVDGIVFQLTDRRVKIIYGEEGFIEYFDGDWRKRG